MGKPSRINPARRASLACILAALAVLPAQTTRAQTASASIALRLPSALAYDPQGNLYIAERGAHLVRRLATDGTLTILAGTGTQGSSGDNGPATAAQLDSPQGLAVDFTGNLYIADTNNHRIRKVVLSTGLISAFAGTGTPGFSGDNGPALNAQFDTPTALAEDAAGALYLADTRNQRVRRIAPDGTVRTVAGSGRQGFSGDNGPATAAMIDSPAGLAIDGAGNLWIADTHNHRIRMVAASSGLITTVAGTLAAPGLPPPSGDGSPAAQASLGLPRGLVIDSAGNLLIADRANQRVRRIAPDGTISTLAGQGTEGFAGDNSAALASSLDAPQALAVAPGAQAAVADSGNARVRQIDSAASPNPAIRTIIGPGVGLLPSTVTLAAPASITYGSGSAAATVVPGSSAGGTLLFLDVSVSPPVSLGTALVSGGSGVLDLGRLSAGVHSIGATYSGDAAHGAGQSQPLVVAVAPAAVTASAQPANAVYGQPIPTFSGTVSGFLPRDTGLVSAVFGSPAVALSPPGQYPVTATLTGPAAANYTLASSSGTLTIQKAPATLVLLASSAAPPQGAPVTLTIQAVSATAGVPTGSVALFDGSSPVAQLPLAAGISSYTSAALAAGAHNFTATYSGDADFLAASSFPATLTVGSPADFSFTASAATNQAVPSGSAAAFAFAITPNGALLASPITLSVSGLPLGATASLNPAYIPPGGAVTSFTLTVQTTKTLASLPSADRTGPLASAILAPCVLFAVGLSRRRSGRGRFPRLFLRGMRFLSILAGITSATLASGCGNRVALPAGTSTAPTYHLTVTGTATSPTGTLIQHAVTVTLQIL